MPQEAIIWDIVRKTGWTWEYVEGLTMQRLQDIIQMEDARNRAPHSLLRRKS